MSARASPLLVHTMDQLEAAAGAAAPALHTFYRKLQAEGFSEDRAFQLTELMLSLLAESVKQD